MARPTLARRLGVATVLTTLALTTAACGNDSGSEASTATDTSTSSEESSEAAGEESSGDLEELEAAEFYPAVMEALQEAETMAFTTSTSAGSEGSDAVAMDVQGVMRYDDDGIDLQASGTGQGDQAIEMIMLDKVLYMTGLGMDLEGKKWLKIDMSDPDSLFGMLGKSTDPSAVFEAMQDPKEFELLGTEEVDGVETNHYRVVMDTAAYVEAMEMPAELTSAMPEEIGVDMWVDADNLPRKFYQELDMTASAGDQTGSATSTTEGTYSDFGTEVTIEAPPASEVADKMPGM
jgi:hypothetical protein